MATFLEEFKHNGNYSLLGMRDAAISLLPSNKDKLDILYDRLNRGSAILESEDLLNMYLYSFGKMHKFKLLKTFTSLFEYVNFDKEIIKIYDWGCGQGLATVCLLDCFKYCEIRPEIDEICLIDPSNASIHRAYEVIRLIKPNCYISTITKDFDSLTKSDFTSSNIKKLHLFSNILDVNSFDIQNFAILFQNVFSDDNFMVSIGPCYNIERMNKFFQYIEPDEIFIDTDLEKGEWLNDWSISIRACLKNLPYHGAFKPILICNENFPNISLNISTLRKYTKPDGDEFSFYWLIINDYICATGPAFTRILGENADTEKVRRVIDNNEGKFQIVQCMDEHNEPIFVDDKGRQKPLLKIEKVFH